MAKIAMFVPTDEMYRRAQKLIARLDIDIVVYQENSQTVLERVKQAQVDGALVAIARGNHAALILRNTDIPLVEIRMSGQILAQLIMDARALCECERPRVAFVGFVNMFTDNKIFEDMLNVSVCNYFVHDSAELKGAVHEAYEDGVDVLIGGEIAIDYARQLGITSLFLKSGEEDLEASIRSARRVLYGIEAEKKNTAEVSTLLNYSFDGIFRINDDGVITMTNYMAERIFRQPASMLMGRHISELFDEHDSTSILDIIRNGEKKYAMVLRCNNMSLVANVAAILVEDHTAGGILSFQEFQAIEELEEGIRRTQAGTGFVAKSRFDQYTFHSPAILQVKRTAEQCARFNLPILLQGEFGTGKRMFAECIHNASVRRNNPFVVFDCASAPPDVQKSLLIGHNTRGALQMAHTGTLFINHIEHMDPFCQYQLLCGLKDGIVWLPDRSQALPVNVRIIASTGEELFPLVKQGRFSEPLYCLLSQMELTLPPLRKRKEDIPLLVDAYVEKYCARYRKYILLTDDAKSLICSLPWPGNVLQLELFIEKLVLLCESRVVDAEGVCKYQPRTYLTEQSAAETTPPEPLIVYGDKEATSILRLLEKHNGSRMKVADELGVSKSTLWRRMKKLGIENSFKV